MLKALIGILGGRVLQQSGVPVLVNLRPFDVALQLRNTTIPVDTFTLQDVVAGWMKDGFEDVINRLGAERFSDFDSVFLTFQQNRRSLLRQQPEQRDLQQSTFLASYSGVSVWKTTEGTETPNEGLVASIQLETTRLAEIVLLPLLQDPSLAIAGLGENVQNVRAQISSQDNTGSSSGGGSSDDGLDVVIIVAIVVACLAFALLGVTLFLAYRRSQEQKEAYKVGSPHRTAFSPGEQGTGETDLNDGKPPENINGSGKYAGSDLGAPSTLGPNSDDLGGGLYPESLISEDISTSLTAYYRGGSGGKMGGVSSRNNSNNLNDAASISSMESYGYSLDGYQSSVVGGYTNDGFLNNAGGAEQPSSLTEADDQLDVPTREFQESAQDPKSGIIEM